jgi:hypothetical protein
MKSTPTEKCSFTPVINPINREGRRLQPSASKSPVKHKDLFSPKLDQANSSFQAALCEISKKNN